MKVREHVPGMLRVIFMCLLNVPPATAPVLLISAVSLCMLPHATAYKCRRQHQYPSYLH